MVNILPVKYNPCVLFWEQGGEGDMKDGVTEGGQLQQVVHRNPTYRPRYRRSVQFLCSYLMLLCSIYGLPCVGILMQMVGTVRSILITWRNLFHVLVCSE